MPRCCPRKSIQRQGWPGYRGDPWRNSAGPPESVPEIDSSICRVSKAKTVSWSCAEAADGAATKAAADKTPAIKPRNDLTLGGVSPVPSPTSLAVVVFLFKGLKQLFVELIMTPKKEEGNGPVKTNLKTVTLIWMRLLQGRLTWVGDLSFINSRAAGRRCCGCGAGAVRRRPQSLNL